MKILIIIFAILLGACASKKDSHYVYPCGIEIASCRVEVQGARSLEDEIAYREKKMKFRMMRTMNLILDQLLQNIFSGM